MIVLKAVAFRVVLLALDMPFYVRSIRLFIRDLVMFFNDFNPVYKMRIRREKAVLGMAGSLNSGDTSYFVLDRLLKKTGFTSDSIFVDCGCSRGHLAYFAGVFYGAKAIGIELVGSYLMLSSFLCPRHVSFLRQNIITDLLPSGTHYWISGTCFSDDEMAQLGRQLETCPSGTWVICITQTLSLSHFELISRHQFLFEWGLGTVLLYRRR